MCSLKNKQGQEWFLTVVYASPYEQKRGIMWDSMKNIVATVNMPWLVVGDFNDISFANKKIGGWAVSTRKCKAFRDSMEECSLFDMQAKGPFYTWKGPIYRGGRRIYEKLDRA